MASNKTQRPVVLHQDKREKAMYEDFADLFAIIKTTEKLERCVRTKRNAARSSVRKAPLRKFVRGDVRRF